MADLAIIVPTRGRPGNIEKVIQAWTDTKAWPNARLVVVFDNDDPQAGAYQQLVHDHPADIYPVIMPVWMPMVHKLDRTAQLLAPDYFALGFAGDDHLPRTVGWSARYLEVLREFGTGIVYGDDGYQGEKLCTEWAMTSDIVRALGRMVPAPVEHMYCDGSVLELGQGAGCIRHLPGVQIEHVHPYAGKTEMDAQYKRVNSRQQFARDKAAYRRWQRRERAGQIKTVEAMMPTHHRIKAGLQPGGKILTQPAVRRVDQGGRKMTGFNVPRRLLRGPGATPDDIALTLVDLASRVLADQAIVELGVYRAKTTVLMAWGARAGKGAHVWGIDAWDLPGNTYGPPFTDPGTRNWARYNVRAQGFANGITLVQGFSLEQAEKWDGPEIGLLFVDDDHSAEMVRANLMAWAPHLAEHAVVAFDDYGHPDWPGVAEAVDAMAAESILDPIEIYHDRLAVTRLRVENPQESAAIVDTNLVGMGSAGLQPVDNQYIDLFADVETHPLTTGQDDGTGKSCPPPGSVYDPGYAQRVVQGEWVKDPTSRPLNLGPELEPAGKTEPVDLDPPPAPADQPEPAGKTEPVDLDPDPNVAVANETVLPGEIPNIPAQTTLDELNVYQLRQLARARKIMLGRERKNRDQALAALRAGR